MSAAMLVADILSLGLVASTLSSSPLCATHFVESITSKSHIRSCTRKSLPDRLLVLVAGARPRPSGWLAGWLALSVRTRYATQDRRSTSAQGAVPPSSPFYHVRHLSGEWSGWTGWTG